MPSDSEPPFSHVTVDGSEGAVARVQLASGTLSDWSLDDLPASVQQGDVLEVRLHAGEWPVRTDHAETRGRKAHAHAALTALNAGAPTGEVDL